MRETDRLLLDCLCLTEGGDAARLKALSARDWDDIIAQAVCHLVLPQLYLGITRTGAQAALRPALFGRMQQLYFRNLAANVRFYHALSQCLGVLTAGEIPVVVLKGAHLGELVYENVGARILSDVDLMVREKHLKKAQQCLMRAGLYPTKGVLSIDLHWYLDTDYPIDMAGVWERTQSARIAGQSVRVLSPEDLLLHLCMHLGSHHQFRRIGIRTFCDIREIVFRYGNDIDWDRVASRAAQWRMGKALGLTLAMARTLLKVEIPDAMFGASLSGKSDRQVFERVLVNIFEDTPETQAPALSPFFWGIWTSESLPDKLKNLRAVLAPSPAFVSQKYPAPYGSFRNYLFYFIRFKAHMLRYLDATWRMVTRESRMQAVFRAERRNSAIKNWLVEENGGRPCPGRVVKDSGQDLAS
ncbi:MAG: nucleotidyltransferase family protein [Desulfobacterales bacterium]|nr:nucleotidyltransferase family protein [Desulfobacterales bacterium]